MEDYISLLPPLLFSLSAFILLIFKANPFQNKIPQHLLPLYILIFILMIWIVYMLAILVSPYTFYNPIISIASLIFSLLMFILVFILLIKENKINDLIKYGIFFLGIVSVLIGFTNYSESKNKVVFLYKNYKVNHISFTKGDKTSDYFPLQGNKGVIVNYYGTTLDSNNSKKIKYIKIFEDSDIAAKPLNISKYLSSSWGNGKVYIFDKNISK